jgi:hypothetical protein
MDIPNECGEIFGVLPVRNFLCEGRVFGKDECRSHGTNSPITFHPFEAIPDFSD